MPSLPSDFLVVSTESDVLSARVLDEKARLQEVVACGAGSVYGSLYTGLISGDESEADLDFSFPLRPNVADRRQLQQSRLAVIAQRLRRGGYSQVEEIFQGAAMPVVKCVDPKTGRKIDVTVGNTSALRNSALLRSFAEFPAVRELVRLVKGWAKREGLVLAVGNGMLSSYTYTLWAVAFLLVEGEVPDLITWEEEGRAPEGAPSVMQKALQAVSASQAAALYRRFMLFMERRVVATDRGETVGVLSLRHREAAGKKTKYFWTVEDPYVREGGRYKVFNCRQPERLRNAIKQAAEVAQLCSSFDSHSSGGGSAQVERSRSSSSALMAPSSTVSAQLHRTGGGNANGQGGMSFDLPHQQSMLDQLHLQQIPDRTSANSELQEMLTNQQKLDDQSKELSAGGQQQVGKMNGISCMTNSGRGAPRVGAAGAGGGQQQGAGVENNLFVPSPELQEFVDKNIFITNVVGRASGGQNTVNMMEGPAWGQATGRAGQVTGTGATAGATSGAADNAQRLSRNVTQPER